MGYVTKHPNKWVVAIGMLHGRCTERRKVAGNTWIERREKIDGEHAVAMVYHATDVVTFRPDGGIVLNSGGYKTMTTKERINWCLPGDWCLSQVKHVWYLMHGETEYTFQDGVIVYEDGRIEGAGSPNAARAARKVDKAIKGYVSEYMEALFTGKVEKPDGGDCWFCSMKTQDGKTLGEVSADNHMQSHINERYYVPSLIVRACEVFPISIIAREVLGGILGYCAPSEYGHDIARDQIGHSLKRYVRRQMGLA